MRRAAYLFCAAALLVPIALAQLSLERLRGREGIKPTFSEGARGAGMAVDTVVLGPFRGLRADLKWMKTIEMQDAHRYYEVEVLCREILELQPDFDAVRIYQSWNLAYNLAAETEDARERWGWVKSGMDLLEEHTGRNPPEAASYYALGQLILHKLLSPTEPYQEPYLGYSSFAGDARKAAAASRDCYHRALRRRGLSDGKRTLAETSIGHTYRFSREWEAGEEWWRQLLHRYAVEPRRRDLAFLGWHVFMTDQAMDHLENGRVREAEDAFARLCKLDPRERRRARPAREFFAERLAWMGEKARPIHEARIAARVLARARKTYEVFRRYDPGAPESFEAWLEARRKAGGE